VFWYYEHMEGLAAGGPMSPAPAENSFLRSLSLPIEHVINIWISDPRMGPIEMLSVVCRSIYINGQEIIADSLYGTARFILGKDGIIRRPAS